jgi:hypothetical protein
MITEIFIDPYALTNPPLDAGADRYLQFVENLLEWNSIIKNDSVNIFLNSEIIEALFTLGLYPLHDTLKASNIHFNVQHISIDSVNKIITSFINKSIIFECDFNYSNLQLKPAHNQCGESLLLDLILEKIYGYMLLNDCESQGLFSPFFKEDSTLISANISAGSCQIQASYPLISSKTIEIFRDYEQTIDKGALEDILKCDIAPGKKKIKLSGDHHGNDKLKRFAKKIFKSPYVIEVINNSAYVSAAKNIINEVFDDGRIHIVLSDTDVGFSMIILTTGKNRFQTQRIADLLLEEYNKKQ